MRLRPTLLASLMVAVLAACGGDDLPDPSLENEVHTDSLGALRSTPVMMPSGFDIFASNTVRTDGGAYFDFMFDFDTALGPAFYPAQAAGVATPSSANPGLMQVDVPFDSVTTAKSNGYILDAPIPIDSGDVLMMRSAVRCTIGVPRYGKLEVLKIDTVAHIVHFRHLVNENCGYRSLEPGLPDH